MEIEYINRAIEEVILKRKNLFKCVLITGVRQAGKTTMLKHLFPGMKYVSFDDPFTLELYKENPYSFMEIYSPPVIFDEVQRCSEIFRFIKIKCDQSDENGLYFLTTSQVFNLIKNLSESLAGRVSIVDMNTFSLREILRDPFNEPFLPTEEYVEKRCESIFGAGNIWNIIHRGGYPALQMPSGDWAEFFAEYLRTYMERDVPQISCVRDFSAFTKFMTVVASRTGQLVNYSSIARSVDKDEKTIRNWISILETSGIIFLLEPYASSALTRVTRSPKLYFKDTGLACYLLRLNTPDMLYLSSFAGSIFETFVVSEIIKSYANKGMNYRYFVSYLRGKDKRKKKNPDTGEVEESEREIDFIIEDGQHLYPIEIKKTIKPAAKMTDTFKVLDKEQYKTRGEGGVICPCSHYFKLLGNVLAIPVHYL